MEYVYVKVIKETEEFEKSLKDMEFLQGHPMDLLKYARDVNCHFASKKCKDVIVAARKLMTSKMHNTVKVCVSSDNTHALSQYNHVQHLRKYMFSCHDNNIC